MPDLGRTRYIWSRVGCALLALGVVGTLSGGASAKSSKWIQYRRAAFSISLPAAWRLLSTTEAGVEQERQSAVRNGESRRASVLLSFRDGTDWSVRYSLIAYQWPPDAGLGSVPSLSVNVDPPLNVTPQTYVAAVVKTLRAQPNVTAVKGEVIIIQNRRVAVIQFLNRYTVRGVTVEAGGDSFVYLLRRRKVTLTLHTAIVKNLTGVGNLFSQIAARFSPKP